MNVEIGNVPDIPFLGIFVSKFLYFVFAVCAHCTVLHSLAETPPLLPPHLGSYTRALLVHQDRRHLSVIPCLPVLLCFNITCVFMSSFLSWRLKIYIFLFLSFRPSLSRCWCIRIRIRICNFLQSLHTWFSKRKLLIGCARQVYARIKVIGRWPRGLLQCSAECRIHINHVFYLSSLSDSL
jgi:hypothetical protein